MAHHKSAQKRSRQRVRRSERNRSYKAAMRTKVKRLRETITAGDADQAAEQLGETTSSIDRAANRGLLHPKAAARKASRLAKAANKIKAASKKS